MVETVPQVFELTVSRLGPHPKFQGLIIQFGENLDEQMVIMENSCKQSNLKGLRNFAQWLKGAAGTLGFDVFAEPATRLEKYSASARTDQIGPAVEHIRILTAAVIAGAGSYPGGAALSKV